MIEDLTDIFLRGPVDDFTCRAIRQVSMTSAKIVIPDSIKEEFREDYDIVKITRIVMAKIVKEYKESDKLLKDIRDLENDLLNDSRNSREVKEKIRELTDLYKIHSSTSRLAGFKEVSRNYIRSYREYPVTGAPNKNGCYDPTQEDLIRIAIIEQYAIYLGQFMDIELKSTGKNPIRPSGMCSGCGTSIRHIMPDADGTISCPDCPVVNTINKHGTHVTEPTFKGTCEDTENFVKALNRYQGKSIPPLLIKGVKVSMENIISLLDKYFVDTGFVTCSVARERPMNSRGIREGTNVEMMLIAMSSIGLNKCYSDVYYICKCAWHWRLSDLSDMEDILIEDYEVTQKAWYTMPSELKSRASSLPIGYRLFQHLRIRGHNCVQSDFKIPKNVSSYNDIWKYMCENCGDPAIRYIPV